MIIGDSGAEFGVRGHITAYNIEDGKRVWRAYSIGPDDEILFDPEKTMSLGKPVGKDSSLKTWNGDQWKIGGGSTWGWYSCDPDLNLFYYGTANPSTWNPAQRAGPDGKPIDQKWTMTIFARNPDTGVAAWAYQMTPFDQWDYDGVNEMILVDDIDVKGTKHNVLVHFDRNGFAYTLDRKTGIPLVAEKYDPAVNWTTGVDLDPRARPTAVRRRGGQVDLLEWARRQHQRHLPCRSWHQGRAAGLVFAADQPLLRADEPRLHGLRAVQGRIHGGSTLCRRHVVHVSAEERPHMGNFIAWDAAKGKIVWSKPEQFSVWSGVLTTAGGIACYGTLEGYLKCVDQKDGKELYQFKTPSGIVGNVFTYEHKGKQYIGVYSGVGGWAGIGLAAGLTNPTDGLGAVGGYAGLNEYTALGGSLTVWTLP